MSTTSFAIDRSGDARRIARWRAATSDPVELLVLGLFVLLALWVLAPDVYWTVARGRFWTGTDGIYVEDQLQYLAWVQSAAQHVLVSNMFVLRPTPADYLQPMVAVSGGLVALGCALGSLVSYQRARADGRLPFGAAALAVLAGWMHPWQGEVLILVLIGAEAVTWALGQRARIGARLLMVGAAGLPLAYYVALGRLDLSWRVAERAARGGYPLTTVIVWLLPLLVPAAVAYRLRPASFVDAAARVWPFALIATFVLDERFASSPAHVFLGISVPLAVLIGQGARSVGWPKGISRAAVATLGAIAFTVPVTVDQLTRTAWAVFSGPRQANFLPNDEAQALDYVQDQSGRGGVLTDFGLGVAVPAETGRATYAGNPFWSGPGWRHRRRLALLLLRGEMRPRQARAFVLGTGARYVIRDCGMHGNLTRLLGSMIEWSHQFGCDRVYTIKLPADRREEFASTHAGDDVRASGARFTKFDAPSIDGTWESAAV